jgi:GT2 family glycosyltransferase
VRPLNIFGARFLPQWAAKPLPVPGSQKKPMQMNPILKSPLFSIVIPAHNRAQLILEALDSVSKQTFKDFEVIVVDDGSTDGTEAVVSEMLKSGNAENLKLKYIRQENKGAGAARNAGAKVAHGEYLAFLDSDDLWLPWTLKSFKKVIESFNRPALISGKIQDGFSQSPDKAMERLEVQSRAFADYLESFKQPCFVGAGKMVVKREVFLNISGFSEMPINLEDHDLALRLGGHQGFVEIVAPATLVRRRHDTNLSSVASRTIAGARHLIHEEKAGKYPGGEKRARQRRMIISRHIRPVAVETLRSGGIDKAWEIYKATLGWHLALGKWKFLIGLPLAIIAKKIGKWK